MHPLPRPRVHLAVLNKNAQRSEWKSQIIPKQDSFNEYLKSEVATSTQAILKPDILDKLQTMIEFLHAIDIDLIMGHYDM